jgi:hypothetical protein
MEDKIIINLDEYKMLNETSALVSLGAKIKQMLFAMFSGPGDNIRNFLVKGGRSDISSFGAALFAEKNYMDSYLKHGLNDPSVLNNRYKLDVAVRNFEKETGIKWPFK